MRNRHRRRIGVSRRVNTYRHRARDSVYLRALVRMSWEKCQDEGREEEKKKFTSEAVELHALPLRAAEDESHSIKFDRYTGTTEGRKMARAVSAHRAFHASLQ